MASVPPVGLHAEGDPGESMRGVTGREPVFALEVAGSDYKDPTANFDLPVDSEHKAKKIKLFSIAAPHMRAFHLSWLSFFTAFCSVFAAPPLIPVIRDNLGMNKEDIGHASIAAVVGAILSRLIIGTLCDLVGPRYGAAFLLMGSVPFICTFAAVTTPTGFIIVRLFIGFSLATFVTCQYWMTSMFNTKIVGIANGVTAGWGNLGGGFIQLVMPLVYGLIKNSFNSPSFSAWRIAFFVPTTAHIVIGICVLLLGQDSPDGQYHKLNKSGERKMDKPHKVIINALLNYRTYVFCIAYGYCFGVELTVDNIIAEYFYDRFDLNLHTAGFIASSFGLMNLFSRPSGGIISDLIAKYAGMRGRLLWLWSCQTLGGVFCLLLGKMSTLSSSIIVMLVFSYFCQAACGATFGVVPFISHRSLGIISGMTGAGGNAGAAITQAVFFTSGSYSTEDGIYYMGIMIICCTLPILTVYFPQWGGIFFPPSKAPTATEEEYYAAEWNAQEKAENLHHRSLKFAENSRSERGPQGVAEFEEKSKTVT